MERESAPAAASAHFDAMVSDPEFKTPPRDYLADFVVDPLSKVEQEMAMQAQGPEPSLFAEPAGESERDLDVPTFLRRLKF
jgi:hypothetical protein